MLRKKWQKLIFTIFTLLLLGGVATWTWLNHQLTEAQTKWENVQQRAVQAAVYTDLDTFLDESTGESPRFLDNFESINQLLVEHEMSYDPFTLPKLHSIPSIDGSKSPSEIAEDLKSALITPPEGDNAQNIYRAILDSLADTEDDLLAWTTAIKNAKGLSKTAFKENSFIYPIAAFRSAHHLLQLRAYCHWKLGNYELSDLETIDQQRELLYKYGKSLLSETVAIAIDLTFENTRLALIKDDSIPLDKAKSLMTFYRPLAASENLQKAMQTELLLQIEYFNALIEDRPHPFLECSDLMTYLPMALKARIRAEMVDFQLNNYFDKDFVTNLGKLKQSAEEFEQNIHNKEYSFFTTLFLDTFLIGVEFYHSAALKSQMSLAISNLEAACTLYKREQGTYPPSLSELTPHYISTLPTIPHINRPYSYFKQKASISIHGKLPLKHYDDIEVATTLPNT
ncbi:hypothetical protein ACFPK9_02520 [Rubritalea spongiae]|uniref:DUF885 domain-containing protein n=1 Tax=Rubritalea spongiae TaxID=430797 RepID=A0ABW5E1W3_9BACT